MTSILWENARNLFSFEKASNSRNTTVIFLVMAQRHAESAEYAYSRTENGDEVFGMSKSYSDLDMAFECLLKAWDERHNGKTEATHRLRSIFKRLPSQCQSILVKDTKRQGLTLDALFRVFEESPDMRYFGISKEWTLRRQRHYYVNRSPERLLQLFKSWFEIVATDVFLNWTPSRIVDLRTPIVSFDLAKDAGKTFHVNLYSGLITTNTGEFYLMAKQPRTVKNILIGITVGGKQMDIQQIDWDSGSRVTLYASTDQYVVVELVEDNDKLYPAVAECSLTLPEETRLTLWEQPRAGAIIPGMPQSVRFEVESAPPAKGKSGMRRKQNDGEAD